MKKQCSIRLDMVCLIQNLNLEIAKVEDNGEKISLQVNVKNIGDTAGKYTAEILLYSALLQWWNREGINEFDAVCKDETS